MNSTRKIIHIDMDCFYASVEIRENPTLQGKPVAVGGSSRQRGVLTTCNYEARKFGLHSAMPTAQAIKKCPNLILVPVNMPLYKQVSAQIHQIFQRYTSIIEPLSLDEAYLDVTDCTQCSGSATWIAQEIRQAIFDELKLTASAGVAPLKFLAKIASDMNKPNGQFVIQPHEVEQLFSFRYTKNTPNFDRTSTMNSTRKIIHIDMDCFYASVEIRENPTLQGKPVAVGGSSRQRGVLTTCNYEARKFGLHSAMPTAQAIKKCPNLILVPVNMPLYKQVSAQIHQIFQRYTSIIEPLSLDEAYLDVTDCTQCSGSATWIAQEIRQAIFDELKLTASAGVAPLKFLAKIASDMNKPNGQFVIQPHEVEQFVKTLPLKKIPGVGKVTSERLLKMGLETCGDVQKLDQSILLNIFGKMGKRIWDFSHGIDDREIQAHRERKSIGVERTLSENISHIEQGIALLDNLYAELIRRIERSAPNIPLTAFRKIGVKLKFEDFQVTTLEKTGLPLSLKSFQQLLEQIWQRSQGKSIRLVGLHVTLPEESHLEQMSLW